MDYINRLIDGGLGEFIDGQTDKALLDDEMYICMMRQAEMMQERLLATELSEAQEDMLDEYISALYDASERACRVAYMTCLKDMLRFLLEMQHE